MSRLGMVARKQLRIWLRILLVAGLWLGWAAVVSAQQAESDLPAADRQAIDGWSLNQDVLQRLMAVVKEGHALGIHPSPPHADAEQGPYTLDAIAAQAISSDPRIEPLLAKYGFTPRQFLLTNMAMSTAALALQARQHPELAGYVDSKHINAANLAFYTAHLDEITDFLRSQQTASDDSASP